jgi:hypothetical protein
VIPYRRLPFALLSLLTVLTAGFAVLAVVTGPSSADVAVDNGTAATFSANQFTLSLLVSPAPGSGNSTVEVIDFHGPNHMQVYKADPKLVLLGSLRPDQIAATLKSYFAVTAGSTGWVRDGTDFSRVESIAQYVARLGEKSTAKGSIAEGAVVRDGYLVGFDLRIEGTVSAGATQEETMHLLRVNGAKAPAVAP